MIDQQSWFRKHKPNTIDEYCFENEEHKTQVTEWMTNGYISGNLVLYGAPGTGKSALAEILIRSIIKYPSDLLNIKDRGVKAIDEVYPWLQKQPVKSKQKIVYIEEFDKIRSKEAIGTLKTDLMEKFQEYAIFLCTTNHINRIDKAIQTRFTYKYSLGAPSIDKIMPRLETILEKEEIKYDKNDLKEFIEKNISIGLRDLINNLQINNINKTIDFRNIRIQRSEEEQKIVELTKYILLTIFSNNDNNIKRMCWINPMNSIIKNEYAALIDIIEYNNDIDYEDVFLEISNSINFIPIISLIDKYISEIEYKKIPYLHFLSFLSKSMESIISINM